MREVCADTEYLRGLDLLVEKPGQHQLHSGKSHMTRRRDIPQPWTWCPRQPCRPRGIRPDARAKPKREQHRTNPDCGTVYVPEQRSSGPRSHQAREDREVSRLGETKASHLVTKRSARSWLSRVRSCCWPYSMSALGWGKGTRELSALFLRQDYFKIKNTAKNKARGCEDKRTETCSCLGTLSRTRGHRYWHVAFTGSKGIRSYMLRG